MARRHTPLPSGEGIDFTRCKSFGHLWDDPPEPPGMEKPSLGYGRLFFRCTRCGTEKIHNLWLATGEGRASYRYPRSFSEVKDTRRQWKLNYYRNRDSYRKIYASSSN